MKATVYHAIRMNPFPKTDVAVDLTKFKKVADLEDDTTRVTVILNTAFRDTNHIDWNWADNATVLMTYGDINRLRSTSVGDLVEVEGKFFMCVDIGWTPVTVKEVA